MWLLAAALWAACKLATLIVAPRAPTARTLAYLFLWPGMDAARFLAPTPPAPRPPASEWTRAALAVVVGGILLVAVVPAVPGRLWLVRGWVALAALVLLLHFGTFHLLSLAWRAAGVDAPPLMDRPLAARSVADFWRRWNGGFHALAQALVFVPLRRRRMSPRLALLAAFVASGLVHDLVISVPARAGFGLPTAYFLIQGVALLAERSRPARRLLRSRAAARAFALVIAAAPAYALFHPPFIAAVVLPMLRASGIVND